MAFCMIRADLSVAGWLEPAACFEPGSGNEGPLMAG